MKKIIFFLFFILFALTLPVSSHAKQIGPYSGRVVNLEDGTPLRGVSVFIYLTKAVPESPFGARSEVIRAALFYTDKLGRYTLPAFEANFGLKGVFESVNIIVYEPGYESHIMGVEFLNSYKKPDPSFKDNDYLIKLKRLPPLFDYTEHVRKIDHAMQRYESWNRNSGVNNKMMDDPEMKRMIKDGYLDSEEFLRRMKWEHRRLGDKEYPR